MGNLIIETNKKTELSKLMKRLNLLYYAKYEERQAEYRRLTIDKQITSSSFKQLFMGTEGFVKKMEEKFDIKNIRLERGRPRKVEK